MPVRLHSGGKTRAWIGRRFGGDESLGDRIWRRVLHLAGAAVLLVYVLPRDFLVVVPLDVALVLALAAVLVLELLRRHAGVQLPTIRPHEEHRVASYAFFAIGLSGAVLLLPEGAAVPAVVGAVLVDPLLGELRSRGWTVRKTQGAGIAAYALLTTPLLLRLTELSPLAAVALGLAAGILGTGVEGPGSVVPLDDDLLMPLAPGVLLAVVLWAYGAPLQLPAF